MTAKELSKYEGRTGLATITPGVGKKKSEAGATLQIPVKILDARSMFGRIEVLITPVGGKGERWVTRKTVTLDK